MFKVSFMNMSDKSLTQNSIYYLICQVLNVLFPFLTGMYVARILMPYAIGRVAYAQNIAQYFAILAFLGIPTYGVREISKIRNNKTLLSKTYTELMIINFLSTTLFLVSYIILILGVDTFKQDRFLFIITGGSIFLNYINNSWLFDGLEEFRFTSIRNIIFKIICYILLIIFVKTKEDYWIYAMITVLGTGGNYLINMLYTHRLVKLNFQNLNLKRHLKPIMILVSVNIAIELYSLVDVSMLGAFCAKNHVAYYSYGSKIFGIFKQIINSFTMVIVPRLALYYSNRESIKFKKLINKTLNTIILLAFPIIVGIQLTAKHAIWILYGDSFAPSANVLRLLSVLLIISPIGYLLGSRVLLVTGNENKMIISVGIGAILNIICNYFFIQWYLEVGAAIASIISEIVVMVIYVIMGKKYYSLSNVSCTIIKSFIATGLMMFCILFIETRIHNIYILLISQIVCGCISYFLSLLILREKIIIEYISRIKKKLIKK